MTKFSSNQPVKSSVTAGQSLVKQDLRMQLHVYHNYLHFIIKISLTVRHVIRFVQFTVVDHRKDK